MKKWESERGADPWVDVPNKKSLLGFLAVKMCFDETNYLKQY